MKTIAQRVTKARTKLLLEAPWFGSLSMRLKIEVCEAIPTFATDGRRILYNPAFAESLTDENLIAVLAHETLHCALLHPFREGNRIHMLANIAQDYAINIELQKANFKLPDGCIPADPQYDGMSWEAIYAKLYKNAKKITVSLGATGECLPAKDGKDGQSGSGQSSGMTAKDWEIAVESATQTCKGTGKIPAAFEEMIRNARKEVADWRAILREFVENTIPSDYSWAHPNRRYIADGLYLPGMLKENMGHIAIAVDTSGSIDSGLLSAFCTEINAIASEAKPERVSIMYCDSHVHRTDEYGQDEAIEMKAVGRGGTAFQPIFDAIAKWPEPPVCLLYLTDLDSSDCPQEPSYPCLWIVSEAVTRDVPFGRRVRISEAR